MQNGDEALPSIRPAGHGQLVKTLSGRWLAKGGRGLAEKFDYRPASPTINSRTALTDTDCSSLYSPILSTVPV